MTNLPIPCCDVCGTECQACLDGVEMAKFPPNCQCDPEVWPATGVIPGICNAFKPEPDNRGWCESCTHDEACHRDAEDPDPNAVDEEEPGRPTPGRGWLEDSGARNR